MWDNAGERTRERRLCRRLDVARIRNVIVAIYWKHLERVLLPTPLLSRRDYFIRPGEHRDGLKIDRNKKHAKTLRRFVHIIDTYERDCRSTQKKRGWISRACRAYVRKARKFVNAADGRAISIRRCPVPQIELHSSSQEHDMSTQQSPAALQSTVDREKVYTWIVELSNPETRENALLELSKKREVVPDLAPMLWHSFGTTASLLQEIINIYPAINPATLTAYQSNRVCNALALLQCVASHPETRSAFLQVGLML